MLVIGTASRLPAAWFGSPSGIRYHIERMAGSPVSADTGTVQIWLGARDDGSTNIQVFTATGTPVGHQVLWSAAGEPTTLLFDCSSHDPAYEVYVGLGSVRTPEWTSAAGLILETRRRTTGEPVDAAAIRRICTESAPVLGRSLIPELFLGVHPHGPSADFVSLIGGTFSVAKPGVYEFATISEDASCLLIDGAPVAEWPGWHDCQGGRRGQHHGRVDLAPGPHRLEYFNVKRGPGYTIEAAWKPPARNRFELLPASMFAPVATFAATSCDSSPDRPAEARFSWTLMAHHAAGEGALVEVALGALTPGQAYEWEFDDGTRAHSRSVTHVFLSTGLRKVKLEVRTDSGKASLATEIGVHPVWRQPHDRNQPLFDSTRRRLMRDNYESATPADLASVYRLAVEEDDAGLVRRIAILALLRPSEFDADSGAVLGDMAVCLQRPDLQDYRRAEEVFKVILQSGWATESRRAWAALRLAELEVNSMGRVEVAQELLGKLEMARLSDSDQRLKRMTEADAWLAAGQLERARDAYRALERPAVAGQRDSSFRRLARLEAARAYLLRRGEQEEVVQLLNEIEQESPQQRMATEPGLIRVRLYLARKEYQRALLLARRLLPVITPESRKADALAAIIESGLALNRESEAAEAYRRLCEGFPYSEATARIRADAAGRLSAAGKDQPK